MHILGSRVGALRVVVAVSGLGLGLGLGISILVVRSLWICPFMNSFLLLLFVLLFFFFSRILWIFTGESEFAENLKLPQKTQNADWLKIC